MAWNFCSGRRHAARSSRRRLLGWEHLEERTLPSGLVQPFSHVFPNATVSPQGYTPAQISEAYGYDLLKLEGFPADGAGQTIAIVNAFDNPRFVSSTSPSYNTSDLHQFSVAFGLPDPPSFTKLDQRGGTKYPKPNANWALETAMDVEWVHALAPQANIILVEADSNSTDDMFAAVRFAASLPGVSVISMSWGADEYSEQLADDASLLTPAGHQGVTFLAASGDTGVPGAYPAFSPHVVAVGGTTLTLNDDDSYANEVGWSGSGGGTSNYEAKPSYQQSISAGKRSIPDVALVADPATGVSVYDSYNFGRSSPWGVVGGTSFSAPAWAALIGIVNQGRGLNGESSLNGLTQLLPALYQLPATDFRDIVSGSNGLPASAGYDRVTGRGTPVITTIVLHLVAASPSAAGAIITKTGTGTDLVEGETTDTYLLALKTQPTADVVVTLKSSKSLSVSPSTLTFTAGDWNVPRTVTVASVDNFVAQGVYPAAVTQFASSTDPAYAGLSLGYMPVTITDNDFPGVTITGTDNLTVAEGGSGATFSVVLRSQPSDNVIINVQGGSQFYSSPNGVTFTPANWNQPQPLTIEAHDDRIAEGIEHLSLPLTIAGGDLIYRALTLPDVAIDTFDNDIPGISFFQMGNTTLVGESTGPNGYTVQLETEPRADVLVALTPDQYVATTFPTLTFTPLNWNQPQIVTVTAVDNLIAEGTHLGLISHSSSSADPFYDIADGGQVTIDVQDNDQAGVVFTPTDGATYVSQAGITDSYAVVLISEPRANVIITIDPGAQLVVVPGTLTFTPQNWNQPRDVQVLDLANSGQQTSQLAYINHTASSADAMYDSFGLPRLAVIADNALPRGAGLLLTATEQGNMIVEGGKTDAFTLRLNTAPTANVILHLASDGAFTVTPSVVTFTPTNWNVSQTVMAAALDDFRAEGNRLASALVTVTGAPEYAELSLAIPVVIVDNDRAGVAIMQSAGTTRVVEGSLTDTYAVQLTSEPAANVTVTLDPDDQLTTSATPLTFTPTNWNIAQTVTVTAATDGPGEGAHFGTITHSATSEDKAYDGIAITSVRAAITDFVPQVTALASKSVAVRSVPTSLSLPFQVTDADTPLARLTVSATSSNQTVLPDANLLVIGAGKNRTLKLTTVPGVVGVATITVSVFDGNTTTTRRFDLQVFGSTTLPASDTFDRSTVAYLGGTWTNQVGRFTSNGQTASAAVSGPSVATLNTAPAANVTVQADVDVAIAGQAAGLVARASKVRDTNLYFARLINNGSSVVAQIWRSVNGTKKLLAGQTVTVAAGTLRFEVVGSSLKLFLKDQLVASAIDSALRSGRVGILGTSAASLDNFSAASL